MTVPNGTAGINPDIPYVVGGTGISGLAERTRDNVSAALNAEKFPDATLPGWSGKNINPAKVQGIDASKVISGTFADARVPSVGALRDAIAQGYRSDDTITGTTASQVKAIFADIASRLDALETPPS